MAKLWPRVNVRCYADAEVVLASEYMMKPTKNKRRFRCKTFLVSEVVGIAARVVKVGSVPAASMSVGISA